MKKNLKWLTILMCSTLLLGGCGFADKPSVAQPTATPVSTPESTGETPSTEAIDTTVETATPAPTEAPDNSQAYEQGIAPVISIQSVDKEWYDEENSALLLSVSEFKADVLSEGFEDLKSTLSGIHPGLEDADYTELLEAAKDHYITSPDSFWGYSSSADAEVTRCDSSVVSLRIFYSDYMGGAHGMSAVVGETFDVRTGKFLNLSDILTDAESFYPKATEYISNKLFEMYETALFDNYETYVSDSFSPDYHLNWYLNSAGIVIAYAPYEVGPYAMGIVELTLPYAEFGMFIQDDYLTPQGEVIARVYANQDLSYLIGAPENIMVETTLNEWDMLDIRVIAGSVSSDLGMFGSFRKGYVIKRTDGRSFLIVVCDYISDDYVTYVYEITDGALKKCDELNGIYPSSDALSTESLQMYVDIDVLGSYYGKAEYTLEENGQFKQVTDFFSIHSYYPITVKQEIPVTIDGIETTLSAGTEILITGTNDVDEAHFEIIDNGQTGIIHYTTAEPGSWGIYINGVQEFECFEYLPYAG